MRRLLLPLPLLFVLAAPRGEAQTRGDAVWSATAADVQAITCGAANAGRLIGIRDGAGADDCSVGLQSTRVVCACIDGGWIALPNMPTDEDGVVFVDAGKLATNPDFLFTAAGGLFLDSSPLYDVTLANGGALRIRTAGGVAADAVHVDALDNLFLNWEHVFGSVFADVGAGEYFSVRGPGAPNVEYFNVDEGTGLVDVMVGDFELSGGGDLIGGTTTDLDLEAGIFGSGGGRLHFPNLGEINFRDIGGTRRQWFIINSSDDVFWNSGSAFDDWFYDLAPTHSIFWRDSVNTVLMEFDTDSASLSIGAGSPADVLHVFGDARIEDTGPKLFVDSTNGNAGFRIDVESLDADSDFLLRVQDEGINRFTIMRNGDIATHGTTPTHEFDVFKDQAASTEGQIENTTVSTSAFAGWNVASDTSKTNFVAHSSARTVSRWGETLGCWSEIFNTAGDGLAIGTTGADPLVLGTNSIKAIEIDSNQDVTIEQSLATASESVTLAAAVTTFVSATSFVVLTGDGGANSVTTITPCLAGKILRILFVDALVTLVDDNSHAADTIDLPASLVGADDTIVTLLCDGTSWYRTALSVN